MSQIITPDDNPFGRANSIIDTRRAVLLDVTDVVKLDNPSDGRQLVGLQLAGRVNRSSLRSEVLYLFDVDGAAAIVSELVGLFSRAGSDMASEFDAALAARFEALPKPEGS